MKMKMLGILTASAVLGTLLSTANFAQERGRGAGLDGGGQRATQMRQMRGPGAPGRGGRHGGFERGARGENFIERYDMNADDQVSAAEFVDAHLQNVDVHFERRDADGNGLIARAEHEARGPRSRGGRDAGRPQRPAIDTAAVTACVRETRADYTPRELPNAEAFDSIDTNGDASLSLAEVSAQLEARALERFERLDGDADGFVTAAEVSTHDTAQSTLRRAVRTCLREARAAAN